MYKAISVILIISDSEIQRRQFPFDRGNSLWAKFKLERVWRVCDGMANTIEGLAYFYLLKAGRRNRLHGRECLRGRTAKIVVAAVERAIEEKVPLYVW